MVNYLELAKEFTRLRTEGKNDDLIAMCADDVVLDHFKDGKHEGKAAYKAYVDANPMPSNARTEEPTLEGNTVKFVGFARKLMMDWKFFIEMTFSDDGKVTLIKTYR